MEWKGKRVCVTGAGGFIGQHLCRELKRQGAEPTLVLRYTSRPAREGLPPELQDCRLERGDITDPALLRRAMQHADVVLHLAALIGIPYSYESPEEVFRVNAGGTLNVLERARELETPRLVVTSTSEVYGSAQQVPMSLEHPLNAQSPYAASKIAGDQLALSWHRSYGLPVAVLRPFNTYGPGQSSRAVIPTILRQALQGDQLELGNLESTRDFLFVEDTVRAFLAAGSRPQAVGRVTHCGTGVETSIGRLVELAGELLGRRLQVRQDEQRLRPADSEVDRLCCDPACAHEVLDWKPQVELREGLQRTLDWLRERGDGGDHGYVR